MIHGESAKGTPLLLAAITPIEIAILLMGNGYANFFRRVFFILENAQKKKINKEKGRKKKRIS